MDGMFERAILFNQPLNDWDVSNVIDFSWMFVNAKSFNQDLNDWNVTCGSSLTKKSLKKMFVGTKLQKLGKLPDWWY